MGLSYKTVTFSTKTTAFTYKGGNICPVPQNLLCPLVITQLPLKLVLSSENEYLGIFVSLPNCMFFK